MLTRLINHNLQNQQALSRQYDLSQQWLHWRRLPLALLLSVSLVLPMMANGAEVYAQSVTTANTPAASTLRAIVGAHSATLLVTPGGESLRSLTPGTLVLVQQRTADSQWVQGETSDESVGWLATEQLILFGLEKLPIAAESSALAASAPVTATAPLTTTAPALAALSATAEVSTTPVVTGAAMLVSPVATPATAPLDSTPVMATVTVTEGRLNVRSGPATDYRIIAKLTNSERFAVAGQSADTAWLLLDLGDGTQGWVFAAYVTVHGALDAVPVTAAVTSAPPISPTSAPAENGTSSVAVAASAGTQSTSSITGLQGTLVFQASQGGAIYLYNLVSGELRLLTSGFDPALSPDGTQVAFTRHGTDGGLFLINGDGSNERKIYGEGASLRSPKWSPDGGWIVFSRTSGMWTCYQLGRECATRQQLVSRLPPNVANDPDAVAKFLAGFDTVENPNYGIARVNAAGDEYRDLAALDTARTPDWGASGIVYQSTAGLQKTADQPDAENQAVVAGHYLQDPEWQPGPEGAPARIVYQSRQGSHWEIFSVNADGSDAVALTQPTTTLVNELPSNGSPAWSPDGLHIVFLSNRTDNHEAGAWRIWVMNADGSDQRPLPIEVAIDYTFNGEQMVSWGD
jgi:Tol biopolymer transport system component/uncharacterized protein YraI